MFDSALKAFSWLVDKFGTTGAGVILFIAGAIVALPYFGIPAYVCYGFGMMAVALAVIIFGKLWAKSEAEKRISNPNLPSSSSVPAIQAEIVKLQEPPK
jgi:hypothetical protein